MPHGWKWDRVFLVRLPQLSRGSTCWRPLCSNEIMHDDKGFSIMMRKNTVFIRKRYSHFLEWWCNGKTSSLLLVVISNSALDCWLVTVGKLLHLWQVSQNSNPRNLLPECLILKLSFYHYHRDTLSIWKIKRQYTACWHAQKMKVFIRVHGPVFDR